MAHARQVSDARLSPALPPTQHLVRGNTDLRKAVLLNQSSQLYVFVLLMTASLLLLFFDWFYS